MMLKSTRAKRRPEDANRRVPDSLTSQFVEKINGLRSSPKTDYLRSQFLTKFVSPDTDPASWRKQRAINKWLATERENEATNDRLLITPGEYNILPRVRLDRFVEWTQRLIETTIGDVTPWESLIGTFSGGASTSRARTNSHPAKKYVGKAHVTRDALVLFEDLLEEMPGWNFDLGLQTEVVTGNVMFTVPKNAEIDRVACKEPDLNMFMQKGVGGEIRRCLKRVGIDLNDQSINQRLAREGSVTKKLATLDLSSASDSVSFGLVQLLMPPVWFSVLASLRCEYTEIDGHVHRNEMFSSMGNGFTFELESLLFYALARATAYHTGVSGVISVYGDDIICPSEMAQDLAFVLQFFGFSVNPEKSYWTGDFRESCGGHYLDGFDVTPFYLRKPIERLTDLIHVANSVREWAGLNAYGILDPEVEEIWLWLKGYIPPVLWGGRDCSFKYSLVTPDFPRKRLVAIRTEAATGDGGYYHWLNVTWTREKPSEAVETSLMEAETTFHRLRPSRGNGGPLALVFYSEINVTPNTG